METGIPFPTIDPILFQIGPVAIRWYALAYVAGILLGWLYIGKLLKHSPINIPKSLYDNLVIWTVLGVIIGGRLGYVLFYNWPYYSRVPSEIFHVWQGGMAFHGGLIGVIVVLLLIAHIYKLQHRAFWDLFAAAAPIGLFFGRVANFINAELYGRVTDVSWAVTFPGTDGSPRHPSQLYQALGEGALLFAILWYFIYKRDALARPGFITGLFLLGYALSRSFVEFYREPDAHIGILESGLTMGQLLSLPMVAIGVFLLIRARHAQTAS